MDKTRRDLLKAAAASSAAIGVGGWPGLGMAATKEPLKIGFVYVGPTGDFGWTYQHDLGRKAIIKALGPEAVKTTYVENVGEGSDADRVIRELAAKGNKLIFTTSFGFMDPTMRAARQFPDTIFEMCTGYKLAHNVGTYTPKFIQGRYLTGLIAGHMTKSNIIGYVAPYPIPEVIRGVNAFIIGMHEVNPKARVKVVFINSWFDPGKERLAAETLINQGADILNKHTDSPAVIQVAESKGVYSFGYDSDMRQFGPHTQLTSIILNWAPFYVETAKQVIAGTWKSRDVWYGFAHDWIQLGPFLPAIPKAVVDQVEKQKQALISGSFKIFKGPLLNQQGKQVLAAGQTLSDHDIRNMNYFLDGVEGQLPKS
ncbi:MAG TPA: BMP family ABC transporter substrate-binding protein [Burkholderiaceae bacterium]|nr:BMP family ABC transporter substrate-binding protein [Burkholderiaceae bacterium]